MPPILKFSVTSKFNKTFTFGENQAGPHQNPFAGSVFYPEVPQDYFSIGYWVQADAGPGLGTMLVLGVQYDNPGNPLLKPPESYTLLWNEPRWKTLYGDYPPKEVHSVWVPVAPSGYVPLGVVCRNEVFDKTKHINGPTPPESLDLVRCLRFDHAHPSENGSMITSYDGYYEGEKKKIKFHRAKGTNAAYAMTDSVIPIYAPKNVPAGLI